MRSHVRTLLKRLICERQVYLLLFFIITLNSVAQVLMKAAASHSVSGAFNTLLLAAVACLGVSFLCWQAALRRKPISFLHPFCSLVYVLVPGLSVIVFRESINATYAAGMCCIIAGVSMTSRSAHPSNNKRPENPSC
jgi:drug/metabolite transporter (DMT)-like permease